MRWIVAGCGGLVVLLAGWVAPAPAAVVDYYGFNQWGGTWCDAEKSPTNTEDDLMCWAAAASNILQWTGWGNVGGMTSADQIFAFYQNHWTDDGGNPYFGWEWWFNGVNLMQGTSGWSQVDVPISGFWTTENISSYRRFTSDDTAALSTVNTDLHDGYGVSLTIVTTGGAHSITAWGVRYDDALSDDLSYKGLYVSDSDDNKNMATPPDALRYYSVSLSGGKWYLQGYGDGSWYIAEVVSLEKNFGSEVPEPTGLVLWGSTLAVAGCYRRRRRQGCSA